MSPRACRRGTFYQRRGKRVWDLALSGALLMASLPVQTVVAVLVARHLGRPVLFRQDRPGRGGGSFTMLKFRTMTDERDSRGHHLPDEDRMTPLGQFLRASSLDELPELWNVLRGDMSLVGPRPLLVKYLPLYTPTQARRHEIRPGVTGWAQVNGRNEPGWSDRLAMDVWYVDNVSFDLDARILWRTIRAVLTRRGIAAPGRATVSEFDGAGEAGLARASPGSSGSTGR